MTNTYKLSKLALGKLQAEELTQFVNRLLTDVADGKQGWAGDAEIEGQVEVVKMALKNLEEALKVNQKARGVQPYTQVLRAVDKKRDNAFITLKNYIKVFRYHPDEKKQKAYLALNNLIRQYKEINKQNYEKASAESKYLISKLESDAYVSHVTLIDLQVYLDHFKSAQDEFEALFAQYSQNNANKIKPVSTTELIKNLKAEYKILVNYILLKGSIKKEVEYLQLLNLVNNSRNYYQDMLNRRGTRKKVTVEG